MKKSIKRMTVGELGSLAEHTVVEVTNSGIASAINDATFVTLQGVTSIFRVSIARKRYSQLNKALATAIKERKHSFVGLKMQLKALTLSKDSVAAEQAEQLLVVFANHSKGMQKSKPVKQTVYLLSLRDALNEPTNQALIKSLKLESWVAQLETAIENFAKLYRERGDDQQKIKTTSSASNLRPKLADSFNDFQAYVKGRKNATKAADWTTLDARLTELVDAAGRTNAKVVAPEVIAPIATTTAV